MIALQADLPARATSLPPPRQLIGDLDEVTDLRLISKDQDSLPTRVAVATNSPNIMVFELDTMNCCRTLTGHADIVLAMDIVRGIDRKAGVRLLASGGKDAQVRHL